MVRPEIVYTVMRDFDEMTGHKAVQSDSDVPVKNYQPNPSLPVETA